MTTTEQTGRLLSGRYRLEVELGKGTSAQVWRAFDLRLARTVAVKLLHPHLAADEGFLRRFRVEARLVAQLNHRHVLRVFDWGEEEDGPFLVGEYLAGGSLRDLYQRGAQLDLAQATAIGIAAAHGLAYAHRRGLVHRDVKPANLLFDEEGETRIADFGIARALADASWPEPSGAVVGTARYASPEQAACLPVDGRSDVYSLALVLYEAVTGTIPFAGDTTAATLQARIGTRLPPARPLGALYPILCDATTSDPDARLGAGDLAVELELLANLLDTPAALPVADPRRADRISPHPDRPDGRFDPPPVREGGAARAPRPIFAEADTLLPDDTLVGIPVPTPGDEEQPSRPRRRRGRRRRSAFVALLVVALVGSGAFAATRLLRRQVAVPDVSGVAGSAANSELTHLGLRVTDGRPSYSLTVPAGRVLAQRPRAGTKLARSSAVELELSLGPAPVAVPTALAGKTLSAAESDLGSAHLGYAILRRFSEQTATGVVLSASPATGHVAYGSKVALVVSKGPHPRTVPSGLVGTPWSTVSAALTALRLVPTENLVYSTTVASGTVMSTTPASGTADLSVGTNVEVTVSKGPPYVTVPSVGGEQLSVAVAQLRAAGLDVAEVIGPPFATTAVTTDPAAGASVETGSSITLYAS